MDSQELKPSYERQQQRMTNFINPLQSSAHGSFMAVADPAMYTNSFSRLSGSPQGELYRISGQTQTLPQAQQQGVPQTDIQKETIVPSANTQRESKRRKESSNQGPYLHMPTNGNHNEVSSMYPSSAAQLSFQQALLQQAVKGSYQSQLHVLNQNQPSLQHTPLDASMRSSVEPVNPSPSRLHPDAFHVDHNRASLEVFHGHQRSPVDSSNNRLPVETSSTSQYGTSTENTYPSPSRSSSEAINASPSFAHPISSRLSYDGLPRNSVQNSSVQTAIHSCSSTQISAEITNPSGLDGSPQNPQAANFREASLTADVSSRLVAVKEWGSRPLSSVDPYIHSILEKEKTRQWKGIELIASENFTSQAVMEVLGSHLVNKYSEGLPGARYYGGNEFIDQIESLCRERALIAFHLDPESWGVNVQPYSCTSANFAVYTALLQPKDRIMGLDSPSGGHLSHGYYTSGGKRVSAASIFFENLPYKVNPETGYIDYDKMEEKALDYRPKILICGGSAYPREWDYVRFRQIADKVGAILMCDMAHISGLVAAQECVSPFDYCDIVTSTTHKSLRGPRGGMIFFKKGLKQRKAGAPNSVDEVEHFDFEDRVNFAVFPSLQGGPHNNQVAALAVALKQVATPEYKTYIQQVKKNAQALTVALQRRGCKLVTGGTDNHLLLWDIRPFGLTGYRFEKVCESCHMTLNKNAVYGDSGTFAPGGVRIGTPAMTSRGCVEADFEMIAEFLFRALQIASTIQREHGKQNKDFVRSLQSNRDIEELKYSVEKFASSFEMPGFDTSVLKSN